MNPSILLKDQTSPYLRMHADDPVEWVPWSLAAFERARVEDKLVLLSVGYASCHWCHVMQRESFHDPETAAFLNDHYIPMKVDREERPDIDALYMEYVAAATGGGGWPMTVALTPNLLPVFGGTYFPLVAQSGSPSFMDVLRSVNKTWREEREQIERTEDATLDFLERRSVAPEPKLIDERLIETAVKAILGSEDTTNGGFGTAPKFPQAPVVRFLLHFAEEAGDDDSVRAAQAALRAILRGGIYDQAGGGICRYATDASWIVPHFEKMLYDNALLLSTLADAHMLEPSDEYAHAIRQTQAFLDREMSSSDGGYIASLSAETDGVEGATYVWRHEELSAFLSAEELALAESKLGVSTDGNWQRSVILTRPRGRDADAESVDAVLGRIGQERASRPQPPRDDKVLVSWNAMTARGLMEAGSALGDDMMLHRGHALAMMLDSRASSASGVIHVLDDPSVEHVRLLEDAAHLEAALITAYEMADDADALDRAIELHADTLSRFVEDGTAFMTDDATDLPVRPREQNDNPLPSGANTFAENALRLYRHTLDESYRETAEALLGRFASLAEFAPSFAGTALDAAIILLTEE